MQYDNQLPLYVQIKADLKKKMLRGTLQPGDRLKPVRDMALEYRVNPNTIQKTYEELEREHMIETQRGVGSFVIDNQETLKALKQSLAQETVEAFFQDMASLGFTKQEVVTLVEQRGKRHA